jgi:hypothetical protein
MLMMIAITTAITMETSHCRRCALIGRSNFPPSLDGFQQDPLSNRACRFPAHARANPNRGTELVT